MFDIPSTSSPFPGLRPFEAHENHLFFGREGQSDDLLQRLSRQRFIAVVGTSGSGKSSLVRAGLLPALHGGFMLRAGSSWRVAILRPGSNPIGRLAEALSQEQILGADNVDEPIRRSIVEASLRRSTFGLIEVVKQSRLNRRENLLIVVDQFEELFRVKTQSGAGTSDDAAAFVKLLLEATNQSELPIYVLITMRSDFLGDCSQFRDLPEAINDGQYLIPRMTRDQRREAILGPVAVGGAAIAPRLVNRLLNDVGENPDQLPVLQHALMRMWQQWEKGGDKNAALDLSNYQSIGGLDEAISQHADEAYDELGSERRRRIAEVLFRLLTERGSDNREIRRPTRLDEICAVAEADEGEVLAIIEAFREEGRSFLMPPPNVKLRPQTFIDISHESLIRGWRRLQHWVDDEALSARIYRRLAETAMLYQAGEAGLWRDPDLAIALAWREKNKPNAAWGARYSPDFDATMSFLEESGRARDAERLERERMRRRNLRLMEALAAVFLIGLCVSLALAGYAFKKRSEASGQALQAKESARLAQENEHRALAAEAATRKEKDRAEDNARRAKDAEEKAKVAAQLAEQNAEKAIQGRTAAEAANRALVVASKALEEETNAAVALTLRLERTNIDSNSSRLRMARRLGEIAPANERAYWQTQEGQALAALGNSQRAIELFSSVLREDPDNFTALSSRGKEYLIDNNDAQKAIRDIEQTLALAGLPYLYINKSMGLSYLGRYDEAITSLNEGINNFTHFGFAEFSHNEVADELEKTIGQTTIYADSDALLTAFQYDAASLAAARGGSDFARLLNVADSRSHSREAYLYALNLSLLHSKARPNDYGALISQGVLWRRTGYCKQAADAYRRFRAEHQKSQVLRYDDLAKWLNSRPQEEFEGVGAGCRNVSGRIADGKAARVYELESIKHQWAGNMSKAEQAISKAIEKEPDNPDFLIERMKLRYYTGDFPGAKADADGIVRTTKTSAVAFLVRAMAKTQLNSSDPTIPFDVREAKKLNPAVYPAINDLGTNGINGKLLVEVLAKNSNEDAIDLLSRATRYAAPSSYPHFMLAKLLNDIGNFKEAQVQINTAIDLDRTRLDYLPEKQRAEAGVSGGKPSPLIAARGKFSFYSNAGDAFVLSDQTVIALDAYSESLKTLNEIAKQTNDVESVRCDVASIVSRGFGLLKKKSSAKDANEYFVALFSELKNIFPLIESELKKLTAAAE